MCVCVGGGGGVQSTRYLTNSPRTNSPQGEVKSAHNHLGT